LYMESKRIKKTQLAAAARAEISVSTAHRIEKGIVTGNPESREWKTRKNPFEGVWSTVIEPKLELHPSLMAITVLEKLQEDYPGQYPDKLLRTLQRKIKKWKVTKGPKQAVMFRQEHFPGKMGISDFTSLKTVVVTIAGEPFQHILYHFRLSYSGWSYVKVIQGGESICALLEGLQEAIWRVGGSPKEHRTDSLSAAYKNKTKNTQEDLTTSYKEFCSHYNMIPTRNNRGLCHENGGIESPHGHVKKRITQALLLRGDNNFESVESYQKWIDSVVVTHNRRNAKEVEFEKEHLTKLPRYKTTDFVELVVRVSTSSTVEIRNVTYSVPSRMIGESLRAHIYQNVIVILYHFVGHFLHQATLNEISYSSGMQ
jgi:transposase InsO family protein